VLPLRLSLPAPKSANKTQHRSELLFTSVEEGDISLDGILAFPIDWQEIASEVQWRKAPARMQAIQEEGDVDGISTMPLGPPAVQNVKSTRARAEGNRHAIMASAVEPLSLPYGTSLGATAQRNLSTSAPAVGRRHTATAAPCTTYSLGQYCAPSDAYRRPPNSTLQQMRPVLQTCRSSWSSSDSSSADSQLLTPTEASFDTAFPDQNTIIDLSSFSSVFDRDTSTSKTDSTPLDSDCEF
jgi:hypothetical protein